MGNSPCLPKRLSGIYGRYCTAASVYARLRPPSKRSTTSQTREDELPPISTMKRMALASATARTVSAVINVKPFFSKGRAGWLFAKCFYCFSDNHNVCNIHYQNHASDNTAGVGESKWYRRQRLHQLALEKIDLNQERTKQHLTYSHDKNHQANLAHCAAKQVKEAPLVIRPKKPRIEPKKVAKIDRPGYQETKQHDRENGQQSLSSIATIRNLRTVLYRGIGLCSFTNHHRKDRPPVKHEKTSFRQFPP
ncbi:uncharacterized protein LOC125771824 isoform X2 [Anopheles funestus]|uniref:uncharacterized protein LOC125771824 isoform X1 n=1 Tax=Anopheles funestus TaxID=62324 RepID=UPI0020C635C8|nr:uncharacterized protein LOC125771824 isoform X1 [Anopheles funestus]XP_049298853.1 uncharacterized protein LOC125771824 isoform X1 [Anopheles funestus]XP_049298854.1 uncharacterized protein LOC125771824 isoform X2 [Anopheles funestus]XP_049298855.1 uncharacterized protein LOC125771824 isoform X1 [Anopheles funestus]XP_049298856.1 uncharacterized protein LOC125771824 isoform X2 [Anopheles funestus]